MNLFFVSDLFLSLKNLEGVQLPSLLLTLPNDRFLDWFKLKTFADGKKKLWLNIVGKGKNAAYKHFLLFCFQNAFFSGLLKVNSVWYR